MFWLNATDNDDVDLQFGVEGDFYNKLIRVNKVDGKRAQVVSNQVFDRESQEKYEDIFFYVKDKPGNKVYQSVRFVILDIDDNPPVFENSPYKIEISENTPIGSVVFDAVEAYDLDGPLYNKFVFNIENKSGESLFEMGKTVLVSNGRHVGAVVLSSRLDYEKEKTHVVKVLAIGENSPFETSAELIVNVLDYPDRPPVFSQSPYYVKIEEEMPLVNSIN